MPGSPSGDALEKLEDGAYLEEVQPEGGTLRLSVPDSSLSWFRFPVYDDKGYIVQASSAMMNKIPLRLCNKMNKTFSKVLDHDNQKSSPRISNN